MGEFDLTAGEKAQIEADARGIVEADDTTAEVYRPQVTGADDFDGKKYTGPYQLIDTIDVDFVMQPDAEVLEPGTDAIADAKPDANVEKWDKLVIRGNPYIVHHVKDFKAFGAETFKRLNIERRY